MGKDMERIRLLRERVTTGKANLTRLERIARELGDLRRQEGADLPAIDQMLQLNTAVIATAKRLLGSATAELHKLSNDSNPGIRR
jgi:hypothetical protein